MFNPRCILTSAPNFMDGSIEAGLDDSSQSDSGTFFVSGGQVSGKHFDHHGPLSHLKSPCARNIAPIDCKVVEFTHMDPDAWVTYLKMTGKFKAEEFAGLNLDTMAKIDENGSSVADKFDPTLLYMVGVGQWLRANKMPRVTEERQDITELMTKLAGVSVADLIEMGRLAQEKAWADYTSCKKAFDRSAGVCFISCDASHAIDPSIAYGDKFEGFDGYQRVVVYRAHYKTVSIYCAPSSPFAYSGQTIAGIAFAGHPKACGSPRGTEITEEQAMAVWSELVK